MKLLSEQAYTIMEKSILSDHLWHYFWICGFCPGGVQVLLFKEPAWRQLDHLVSEYQVTSWDFFLRLAILQKFLEVHFWTREHYVNMVKWLAFSSVAVYHPVPVIKNVFFMSWTLVTEHIKWMCIDHVKKEQQWLLHRTFVIQLKSSFFSHMHTLFVSIFGNWVWPPHLVNVVLCS